MSRLHIPGQPRLAAPEFARWLNGDLTLCCGKGYHESCRGTIDTIGITAPCLCKCHRREPGEEG